MTDLRTAAQQALEALEKYQRMMLVEAGCQSEDGEAAIDNLRAALTEDALQKFTEVSQEIEAALAEPVQQGCEHCNHPLYVAIKCRVCGRVTEPVQEPVAWAYAAGAKAEQDRCCKIVYGMAGSDNVAQRTVDAIRGKHDQR